MVDEYIFLVSLGLDAGLNVPVWYLSSSMFCNHDLFEYSVSCDGVNDCGPYSAKMSSICVLNCGVQELSRQDDHEDGVAVFQLFRMAAKIFRNPLIV